MKFTRGKYPDYPGADGDPCWRLTGSWLDIDADWNTRFPFGASFSVRIGPQPPPMVREPATAAAMCASRPVNQTPGFLLDLNAPLGEPNRLYLWLVRWHVTLGLPSVRDFQVTGREITVSGKRVIHGKHYSNWRHPHLDGLDRYRYHQDEAGHWTRNARPEPLHWGWLTIERKS